LRGCGSNLRQPTQLSFGSLELAGEFLLLALRTFESRSLLAIAVDLFTKTLAVAADKAQLLLA